MSRFERPADDVIIVQTADLPYEHGLGGPVVLTIEAGSGTLAVKVPRNKRTDVEHTERVLTVTEGEKLVLGVTEILDETTAEVDGYAIGTTTQPTKIRVEVWKDG